MTLALLLEKARSRLANRWLLALFGGIYVVSQVVIATIVHPLDTKKMVGLQIMGFSAETYKRVFSEWETAGTMPFYRAHLIFDDIHWVWYSIALSCLLAICMNAARAKNRWNIALLLPPLAGLQDCLENTMQHVFLSSPTYVAIIDPLPAISAAASIGKWIMFLASFVLSLMFTFAALRSQPKDRLR